MPLNPRTPHRHQGFDTSNLRARRARKRTEQAAVAARLHALVLDVVPPILARFGATAA